MGPNSLSHVLRAPFEKIGSVALKKHSLHHLSAHEGDIQEDLPSIRRDSPAGPQYGSPLVHSHQPDPANGVAFPVRSNPSRPQQHQRLFRRNDTHAALNTDDEKADRDFHLRKLFPKGQRTHPMDDRRPNRRNEVPELIKNEGRSAELRHLEDALVRDTDFRERQAEVSRQIQLDSERRERIRQVEKEIYQDRLE